MVVERFRSRGISVEEHNINADDYTRFRSIIYQKRFASPLNPLAQRELERLIRKGERRVDHREDESKDTAGSL